MKLNFITLFLLVSLAASAQDYVVTLKGDTVRGETKILSYDLYDRINVKSGKTKNQFTAVEVKAVFMANQIYHTIRTDLKGYRMMKLIKPGYLSLYEGRIYNGSSFEIVDYLVKKDGSSLEVPNLSFKKSMINFLSDCLSMEEKINSEEVVKKNLDQLINVYNQCIESQTKTSKETASISREDPKLVALLALKSKVEKSTLTSQKDVLDILNDLTTKIVNNKPVPKYLLETLNGMLKDTPEVKAELDQVNILLKNE